jgi:hypothetical protein
MGCEPWRATVCSETTGVDGREPSEAASDSMGAYAGGRLARGGSEQNGGVEDRTYGGVDGEPPDGVVSSVSGGTSGGTAAGAGCTLAGAGCAAGRWGAASESAWRRALPACGCAALQAVLAA